VTTTSTYWVSQSVLIDWALTTPDGSPASGATIVAGVTLPDGSTVAPVVTETPAGSGIYRMVYDPPRAGTYAYRMVATGVVDSATEGTFAVQPSPPAGGPYDPSTPVGLVRLLINDVGGGDAQVFSDAEVTAFLALAGQNARRAAAEALDTLATNEALVSKVIRTQDLATDGAKLSAELRARAATLREQANLDDDAGFGLQVVDYDPWAGVEASELTGLPWVWP
jgi:hypothetical protein